MFTLKDLKKTLNLLFGVLTELPILLVKKFFEFTLIPKPYLFRWGDAYDK